ncbi:MAG: hypothetical protein R2724_08245 [Bryobacterales bacterium]
MSRLIEQALEVAVGRITANEFGCAQLAPRFFSALASTTSRPAYISYDEQTVADIVSATRR